MRNKPQRAFWLNGYQAAALFDNAQHERKPVISIFREFNCNPVRPEQRVRNPVCPVSDDFWSKDRV